MSLRGILVVFACVFLLLGGACASSAAAPEPRGTASGPRVRVELLSEVTSFTPGQTFWVGLHQRISPGWHTYWMNPGDSGEPPRIEWALPSGFTAGEIAWPFPERIPAGPAMTYGYSVGCSIFGRFTTEGSGSMPGPTEAQPAHGARTRCRGARAPHRRTHARRPIAGKRTRRPRGCRGGSCGADYPIRPAGTQARGGPLTPRSGYDYG